MSPLRVLVGLITLAYAAYVMIEGWLCAVSLFGPLPFRLIAAFGGWMQLAAGQPWWRAGLQVLAGFTFAAAGAQLAGSWRSAWGLFAMAAATELTARWAAIFGQFSTVWTLRELIRADQLLLTGLAGALAIYIMLGQARPEPGSAAPAVE